MGLSLWSSSCICCGLTTARKSLPIYQLLNRAYISARMSLLFSSIELTVSAQ
ncbi:hypothetical protein F383_30952 [Gossypium arboreum]|uniref:Uncharacterized protein n=1 Tax=Gossypium arboreum TaxID=29729 RepID=A0A0B0PF07_GOSAR|nr:hypothetical protein F383_30952 [Gossypium arboreum]